MGQLCIGVCVGGGEGETGGNTGELEGDRSLEGLVHLAKDRHGPREAFEKLSLGRPGSDLVFTGYEILALVQVRGDGV